MTLDIEQYEYLRQTGDTAGIVVVIRPQNQMPFPEDDGIIVSPGHATSIALTQVRAWLLTCTGPWRYKCVITDLHIGLYFKCSAIRCDIIANAVPSKKWLGTEQKGNCWFVHRITTAYTAGNTLFLCDCDLSVCLCSCSFAQWMNYIFVKNWNSVSLTSQQCLIFLWRWLYIL